jgi:hypothetical protein
MTKARLVGFYPRPTRHYVIRAKFETADRERREIVIDFPVGRADSPHLRTLVSVLEACFPNGARPEKWADPQMEAVFSVPRDGTTSGGQGLEDIALLSLKPKGK